MSDVYNRLNTALQGLYLIKRQLREGRMATVCHARSLRVQVTLVVVICLTSCVSGQQRSASSGKPALAILLAIDQLRPDLLDRYDTLFVGGFRRLLDEGYRFTNATHDHARTATGPGHTTLSTGVYPSRHGIVGNSWSEFDLGEWRSVYSVEDLDRRDRPAGGRK